METEATEIPDKRTRVAEAFRSYETDEVRIVSRSLAGATHIVASRRGLYAINGTEWAVIAQGYFFGLTLKDGDIFAFEACDQPHSQLSRGRIVRFEIAGNTVVASYVLAKGLDNGCHQIDFFGEELNVVDTYNQQIVRFSASFDSRSVLSPLPVCETGRWHPADLRYVHVNSLLRVGDANLLLLHNSSEHTGRSSELAAYDTNWQLLWKKQINGKSCHGISVLEDGRVVVCDSIRGDLISTDGTLRIHVAPLLTRGLAIGSDGVVVGCSLLTKREDRLHATGTVTFMDNAFGRVSELVVPGSPTEIRRLDGLDYGLSNFVNLQNHSLGLNV